MIRSANCPYREGEYGAVCNAWGEAAFSCRPENCPLLMEKGKEGEEKEEEKGEKSHTPCPASSNAGRGVFLFGSRARGTAREGSDWDVFWVPAPVPRVEEFLQSGELLPKAGDVEKEVRRCLPKGAALHFFVAVRVGGGFALIGPDRDEPLEPWLVPDRIPRVWGSVEEMVGELRAVPFEEPRKEVRG